MKKNAIIGFASGYTYDKLEVWLKSAERVAAGTETDVILFVDGISAETLQRLREHTSLIIVSSSPMAAAGDIPTILKAGQKPHNLKFISLNQLFRTTDMLEKYAYVVITDVRDVYFHSNPFTLMNNVYNFGDVFYRNDVLLVSCEGIYFENEPWGYNNIREALGADVQSRMSQEEICNVGVIMGGVYDVYNIIGYISSQCALNMNVIRDQAVYNHIIYMLVNMRSTDIIYDYNISVNLGTTKEAIKSGAGDIGQDFLRSGKTIDEYCDIILLHPRPVITDQLDIINGDSLVPFAILHQYDRIPGLEESIRKSLNLGVVHVSENNEIRYKFM